MSFIPPARATASILAAASLCAGLAAPAQAAILLGGTRVIVHEKDREASISMKNEGKAPYVVQAWLDAGEGRNKTPFLTTPPLSRLDPGMENILRIMRVSSNELPADRESVFWLNVKEIPEKAQGENVLQIAVRTRIKLFYRPAALRDGDASLARNSLKWAVTTSADGKGAVLKVANPTPYHVTFTGFRINKGQQDINTEMLPPMAEQSYPLKAIKTPQAVTVTYTTINDYGGETALEVVNVPAANEPVPLKPEPVPDSAGKP